MPSEAKEPKSEQKAAKSEQKQGKSEQKGAKAEGQPPKGEKGEGKGGKAKAAPDAAPAAAPEKPKAPPEPPRPPADPRLKVLKKFHGKFLPRGPLRERHTALMTRWNSGEEHGGVTVQELKSLLDDWKATKAKTHRAAQG
jgi:hypothetical protein